LRCRTITRSQYEYNIGLGSAYETLKKNKFYLFKIYFGQELSDDDFDRCIEFFDLKMDKIIRDLQFQNNIFSDEVILR